MINQITLLLGLTLFAFSSFGDADINTQTSQPKSEQKIEAEGFDFAPYQAAINEVGTHYHNISVELAEKKSVQKYNKEKQQLEQIDVLQRPNEAEVQRQFRRARRKMVKALKEMGVLEKSKSPEAQMRNEALITAFMLKAMKKGNELNQSHSSPAVKNTFSDQSSTTLFSKYLNASITESKFEKATKLLFIGTVGLVAGGVIALGGGMIFMTSTHFVLSTSAVNSAAFAFAEAILASPATLVSGAAIGSYISFKKALESNQANTIINNAAEDVISNQGMDASAI